MELVPDGAVLTSVPLNDSLPVVRAAAGASESVTASPTPNTATRDARACRLILLLPSCGSWRSPVAAWRAAHRRLSQRVDPPSTRARSVGDHKWIGPRLTCERAVGHSTYFFPCVVSTQVRPHTRLVTSAPPRAKTSFSFATIANAPNGPNGNRRHHQSNREHRTSSQRPRRTSSSLTGPAVMAGLQSPTI